MTGVACSCREIDDRGRTVRAVFDNPTAMLTVSHEKHNERSLVSECSHYFFGSIIITRKDGQKIIIDSQITLSFRIGKSAPDAWQVLYQQPAEPIWSAVWLDQEAPS